MARRATVTEADMRRAIKAANEAGLTIRECVMEPKRVRLIFEEVEAEVLPVDTRRPKPWPK